MPGTGHSIGGCSFIQLGGDPAADNEMHIGVHPGARQLTSPGQPARRRQQLRCARAR